MDLPVSFLGVSQRCCNALNRSNITTVGKLLKYSMRELFEIHYLGEFCIEEIIHALEQRGLSLIPDPSYEDASVYSFEIPDSKSISILEIPPCVRASLQREHIYTIGDLVNLRESELLDIPRVGVKIASLIKDRLAYFGRSLAPESDLP